MGYFLAAYGLAWALIFVYVASLHRRQARIERELHRLEEMAAQLQEP